MADGSREKTARFIIKPVRLHERAVEGRRYHARVSHAGGRIEYCVGECRRDAGGRLSLAGLCYPLGASASATVELIGCVIGIYLAIA